MIVPEKTEGSILQSGIAAQSLWVHGTPLGMRIIRTLEAFPSA